MTAVVDELVVALDRLSWADPAIAHKRVERVLGRLFGERPARFGAEIADWAQNGLAARAEGGHETSTHYKWPVATDAGGRFRVWLHEYKPTRLRGMAHARVPHDHRYWFSSVVLYGGFVSQRFIGRPLATGEALQLRAGDTFTMSPDQIHVLEAIEDGTLTLIVQGRVARHFSRVYDLKTGEERRFNDFVAQYEVLACHPLVMEAARRVMGS